MQSRLLTSLIGIAAGILAVTTTLAASAQRASSPRDVLLTNSPSTLSGIGMGFASVGANIGFGMYTVVRHDSSLTGCVIDGSYGLQIETEGDGQTYALVGEVSGIKPGERIRLSGKKEKHNDGVPQVFLVEKLKRDYGACPATSAAQ